jgi:hypothetical protein
MQSAKKLDFKMTLEKIIKQAKEISKGIGKSIKKDLLTVMLTGSMALSPFLGGCGKSINPLGGKIQATTSRSADYNFCGDTIEAAVTPIETPYQSVEVAVKKPGDADYSAYEQLTTPVSGTFKKSLATLTYGTYQFKFRIISDRNDTANEHLAEVPVYMNEAQSDAALEQAINDIGVNASTTTKGEIRGYTMNSTFFGYVSDVAPLTIRCRGPPTYVGSYCIDVQGSKNDTLNENKKNTITSGGEGYIFISPVTSKDEIKSRILQEKNANWPLIVGY